MKLPIKFRGKTHNGKSFYGDLIHRFGMVAIGEYGDYQEVEPDSIKQLVGYDKNGHEVYDGDALQTEEDGTIYAAVLRHAKVAPCDDMSFTEMAKRCGWTVKEADKNGN